MNDIHWHHRDDDDFYDILVRYYNHTILTETNIGYRIDNTNNFCSFTGKLLSVNETLIRFAFID